MIFNESKPAKKAGLALCIFKTMGIRPALGIFPILFYILRFMLTRRPGMISATELQEVFHSEIPITKYMGLTVRHLSADAITVCAPLAPNMNHKSTAFGGSIYSVTVLTGWGLLYSLLSDETRDAHIVIFESNILFHLPVKEDFCAVCRIPETRAVERFLRVFRKKGRAKIKLLVQIITDDGIAVSFQGTYVAHI